MKKILFFWIALSSAVTVCTAQSTDVAENERIRFARMIAKDTAALAPMLAHDLTYVHSNGLTETKAQHLKAVGSGAIAYQSMTPVNPVEVRRFKKVAYTFGRLQVKGMLNGTPFDVVLHYSALYEKRHGRWVLLNWQSTKIK